MFVPVPPPTSWYGVAGWNTVGFTVLHTAAFLVFVVIGLEPPPSPWWSALLDAAFGALAGAVVLDGLTTVRRRRLPRRAGWTALALAVPAAGVGAWVQPVAGGNSPLLTDSDLSFYFALGIPVAVMAVCIGTVAWLLNRSG